MDRLPSALRPDGFTLAILATVVVASLAPATGTAIDVLDDASRLSVMALFLLHGARLAREAVLEAIGRSRLQLTILAVTFVLFPCLALATAPLLAGVFDPALQVGIVFLCCLPSTVQSSIAFTSMAQGNVAAAACAASASNLLGIVATPLLTGLLLARHGGVGLDAVGSIVMLVLGPFVAGQLLRPRIGAWVMRQRRVLSTVDRGSILLMVYAAFGKAVVGGVWQRLSAADLVAVTLACMMLLAVVILLAVVAARRLRFDRADEATIVFCGSMKSLVTGLPLANALFPGAQAGVLVIPLIVYHQVQLLVCAVIARRYGATRDASP